MTREQTPPQVKTYAQARKVHGLFGGSAGTWIIDNATERQWQIYVDTPLEKEGREDKAYIKLINNIIRTVWHTLTPEQQAQIISICKE